MSAPQLPGCLSSCSRSDVSFQRTDSICFVPTVCLSVCVDKKSWCCYQPQLHPNIKRWRRSGWNEVSSIDMLISVTLVHLGLLRVTAREWRLSLFVSLQYSQRLKPLISDRKRGGAFKEHIGTGAQ